MTQTPDGKVEMNINVESRLSQPARSGCDKTQDLLYLNPLEASQSILLASTNGTITADLYDKDGRQTLQLTKQTAG